VKRARGKKQTCPLDALAVASGLYVYSRLGGESRADALKRADDVMRGWDTTPCSTEFDLLAPPKRWEALREELGAVELPRLTRR
jgi:hypothetical protein